MIISLIGFLVLPAIGIISLFINLSFGGAKPRNITIASMLATTVLFVLGLLLGFGGFSVTVIKPLDFSFSLATNSLSVPFLLLATIVPLIAILSVKRGSEGDKTLFYVFYLLAYMSAILVFVSENLILLFVFWEVTVLSLFFMISLFGSGPARRAGIKFLIFTQFGSLTLLGAFILVFLYTGSFSLSSLFITAASIPSSISYIIFVFVLITAMIKMPVFPLHEWLPDAYVSAPNPGTIFLSAVMSKLGGYILLLFGFELFPSVLARFSVPLVVLGVLTVIYMAFAASAQRDLKRMLSYSSVMYMGLIFIGIVSVSSSSLSAGAGSVMLMVSHAFVIGALFTMSYALLLKSGTNDMSKLGGLMKSMPLLSFFFVFAVFATLGVPGLSNFVGELLIFIGAYSSFPFVLVSLAGLLIATNYYLSAVKRIFFGAMSKTLRKVTDISPLDVLQLSLFSFFILLIGLFPSIIMNSFAII